MLYNLYMFKENFRKKKGFESKIENKNLIKIKNFIRVGLLSAFAFSATPGNAVENNVDSSVEDSVNELVEACAENLANESEFVKEYGFLPGEGFHYENSPLFGIFKSEVDELNEIKDSNKKFFNTLQELSKELHSSIYPYEIFDVDDKEEVEKHAENLLSGEISRYGDESCLTSENIIKRNETYRDFYKDPVLSEKENDLHGSFQFVEGVNVETGEPFNYAHIQASKFSKGSGYYYSGHLTTMHEIRHINQMQFGEENHKELQEVIPSLLTVIHSDQVYKEINDVPLDKLVDYDKHYEVNGVKIEFGKMANFYRGLHEKYGSMSEALLSEESVEFLNQKKKEVVVSEKEIPIEDMLSGGSPKSSDVSATVERPVETVKNDVNREIQDEAVKELKKLAKDKNTHPLHLNILGSNEHSSVRALVAGNPSTLFETLYNLSTDVSMDVLTGLIDNKSTHQSSYILHNIAENGDEGVRGKAIKLLKKLASGDKTSYEELLNLSQSNYLSVLEEVASNTNLPIDAFWILSNNTNPKVLKALLGNKNLPFDIKIKLSQSKQKEVQFENQDETTGTLKDFANSQDPNHRLLAAEHYDASADLLYKLTFDSNERIRSAALQSLEVLSYSDNYNDSFDALEYLKNMAGDPNTSSWLLNKLSKSGHSSVKEIVAWNPNTSDFTLNQLSNDLNIYVRNAALENL